MFFTEVQPAYISEI
ncbi:unnamed protein product [Staurois parvus]|uniref:Uncharacterized protein n=1 Tax=Staurois parvus TaxID=386267 RepID=A0ABN9CZ90_9NEOB|nr:unnamed protein product [Staurois parvus]CAI9594403.1 unnamed protein product [Staurois parvus]